MQSGEQDGTASGQGESVVRREFTRRRDHPRGFRSSEGLKMGQSSLPTASPTPYGRRILNEH